MHIDELLNIMVKNGASDLHLKVGSPPLFRIHGELLPLDSPALTTEDVRSLVGQMANDEQKRRFDKARELDLAYNLEGVARFRVNVFLQRMNVGAVIRLIPLNIKLIDDLGFPPVLKTLALKPRGLVLVTGPTGCGKSTTLAAMTEHINNNRRCHIMTIEDPIEFVHQDKKSVINQRELGSDTLTYVEALKHVLRQDPDVILIGEMRDFDTIALAITAAETGHLVFSTLHTVGSSQTIDRIIDAYPPHQQQQIRNQLSTVLEGVVSQVLLPTADGKGRVAALDIMVSTAAVRNLIRDNKTYQISSVIQTGAAQGMQTLDASLKILYQKGLITYEEALTKCTNPETFKKLATHG